MSTLHNTGGRLWALVREHRLAILATVVVLAFATVTFATTFRIYDERQFRLDAVAEQARMNAQQAEANRMTARDLCVGLNDANETLRNLLDGALRARPPGTPIADEARRLTIDTYRRLPSTDCETGAKTYYDPPFPTGS